MAVVKIYGERNSGTNYLEQLIYENLDVPILKYDYPPYVLKLLRYEIMMDLLILKNRKQYLGWKHGCPPVRSIQRFSHQGLSIITITKNPYTFLLSLHRRPYHNREVRGLTFGDFIRHPWQTIIRDNLKRKRMANSIVLWNQKNKALLELKAKVNHLVINLRYEDVLKQPEKTLHTIAAKMNVSKKHLTFQNIKSSTKDRELDFNHYQSYYLEEKWKNQLQAADIAFINQYLDKELMRAFGYDFIETTF